MNMDRILAKFNGFNAKSQNSSNDDDDEEEDDEREEVKNEEEDLKDTLMHERD